MVAALERFDLSPEWIAKIRRAAPTQPAVRPKRRRRALLYSVSRGFQHWVTPHTSALLTVLAQTSGAFEVVETEDARHFVPEKLSGFDAVIFNNTCPVHPRRDSFRDVLEDEAEATRLKESIIEFVAAGGGFVSVHGGIIAFNTCPKWDAMQGGSFDYHPAQQELTLTPVDPGHPLVRAFGGTPFVHVDEPYLFKGSYASKDFRPLLVMDKSRMVFRSDKPEVTDTCYAAWIRRHGKGRFFYSSPSHNAQSFEDPRVLGFLLDGIQYALGDLECDDSSVGVRS